MRRIAWVLLVLFVFAIPWEYSLDVGAPFGNVARILGVLTLLAAVPAVLHEGGFRRITAIHWLTLAFYLWQCCGLLWSVVQRETLFHLRAFAQEMMLVWLIWEFVDSAAELKLLLRAWLTGTWVLTVLTIAGFVSSVRMMPEQVRFAAVGQDPNDVARLLVFGFPIAVMVAGRAGGRVERILCLAYLPVGFAAILLTASRSGLLLAVMALMGCGVVGLQSHSRAMLVGVGCVFFAAGGVMAVAPAGTVDRLGSAAEAREYGNLNQRVNIWLEGWKAFESAPMIGHGVGSFVSAAKLAPEDTAHNTALSILVEEGLCGLALSIAILVVALHAIWTSGAGLRNGLLLLALLWAISSLTGTQWENRTTWLLFGVAAVSGRIAQLQKSAARDSDQSPVSNCEEAGAALLA